AVPSTTTSLPVAQPLAPMPPVATATCGLPSRLCDFCSSAPVQKANAPSYQTPTSGTACGRPSARTVTIQESCACARSCSMSYHGGAVGAGSPYRGSICPVVILTEATTSPRRSSGLGARRDGTDP